MPCLDTAIPHILGGQSGKGPISALLRSITKNRSGEPKNRADTHRESMVTSVEMASI
jgi:hypothetical protein